MAPRTADFTGKRLTEEILAMAQGMERRMQAAFIRSVRQIADDPELIQLLQDIQAGKFIALTPEVENRINRVNLGDDELRKVAQQAMAQSGRVTTRSTGLNMRFDITNPRAVQTARTMGAELVTNINSTTRQTLREIISEMTDGTMSFQAGRRAIANEVGLLPQHRQAVIRYRQSLAASGRTYQQVMRESEKYAKRLLNYRAEVIARTEVAKATSLGQLEAWNQALDNDLIPPDTLRVWITAPDERLCAICAPMEGETATIDGVWETPNGPVSYPTAIHPQCRCSSGLVFPTPVRKVDPNGYEYWLLTRVQKSNPWRITKADRPEILKGDYPGHPFRGNQWIQFPGGVPTKTGRQSVNEIVDRVNTITLDAEAVEYDDYLKKLREDCHGGETHYLLSEGGSYYDEIDWDSDVDPVEQMFLSFEDYTGIVIDRRMGRGLSMDKLEVEAVAETLDAVSALQDDWGIGPQVITFKGDADKAMAYVRPVPSTTVAENYKGQMARVESTVDREYFGQMDFNPTYLTPRGAADFRANKYTMQMRYQETGHSHHVPVQVTPHQSTAIHEFAHVVHNWAFAMNPGGLWNVASTMVEVSAEVSGQRVTARSSPRLDAGWQSLSYQSAQVQQAVANGTTRLFNSYIRPEAIPTGSTARNGGVYLNVGSFVSGYSNANGLEFWAETFTLVYGNPGGSSPALRTNARRNYGGAPVSIQAAMTTLRSEVLDAFNEEFG